MSSAPMTSKPPAAPGTKPSAPETKPPDGKQRIGLERLAAWVLPLAAVCLLLVALTMAVRSGEMQWATAGITVYAVCLAIWVGARILRVALLAAKPVSAATTSSQQQTPPPAQEEPSFQTEFRRFARFANSLFPWLALAALTGTSFAAAVLKQQRWLTTGIVSLCGWCLVWIGHLVLPSVPRIMKTPQVSPSGSSPSATDRFRFVGLLLLSFLIVSVAVWFGVNPGRMRWLAVAAVALAVYFAGLVRRPLPDPTAVEFSLAVLPGVLLVALASGLAVGVYLHRLSWIAGWVTGYVGCLAIFLFQIIRSLPKATTSPADVALEYRTPSRVPILLTAALLASLSLALYLREISALKAALLAILGGLSLWFAWMFVSSVEREGPPQVETNWGGLGGGLGGWRCSASLVYGLCALTLAVCTGFTFLEVGQPAPTTTGTHTKTTESNSQQPAEKNDSTSAQPSAASPTSTNGGEPAATPATK